MNTLSVRATVTLSLLTAVGFAVQAAGTANAGVDALGHISLDPSTPLTGPLIPDADDDGAAVEPHIRSVVRREEAKRERGKWRKDCVPAELLNPTELHRNYSSVYRNYEPGTYHARSMLDSPFGWQARHNATGESMTMDLGGVFIVNGAVTQGRAIDKHPEWVEKFTVQTSVDGERWRDCGVVFKGNKDPDTKVENHFLEPIRARFVKLTVLEWHSHISMRAGVLTCEPCVAGPLLNPPEESRNYSSIMGVDTRIGEMHAQSMLNSPSAWTAHERRAGEWMTINLGHTAPVRGFVLQGTMTPTASWVTRYRVEHSADGRHFEDVGEVFEGNVDAHSPSEQLFGVPIMAQFWRLVVLNWHGDISMKAGVLTCKRGSKD